MTLYAMAMALSKQSQRQRSPGLSARKSLHFGYQGGGSNSRAHYDTFSHNIHSEKQESELALASQPLPFAVGKL